MSNAKFHVYIVIDFVDFRVSKVFTTRQNAELYLDRLCNCSGIHRNEVRRDFGIIKQTVNGTRRITNCKVMNLFMSYN